MARFAYTTDHGLIFSTAYVWDYGTGLGELYEERRFLSHRRCVRWASDRRHELETEDWGRRIAPLLEKSA
jgi:hypothetical protein